MELALIMIYYYRISPIALGVCLQTINKASLGPIPEEISTFPGSLLKKRKMTMIKTGYKGVLMICPLIIICGWKNNYIFFLTMQFVTHVFLKDQN